MATTLQQEHMYCVFRRGAAWFAVAAVRVREVLARPLVVAVPGCDARLAGLCHVRSEFLPVLRLDGLVLDDVAALAPERQMLVIGATEGAWALLVDQVADLAALEASTASHSGDEGDGTGAVIGWAAHQDQMVRVLDPDRFYRLAETAVEQQANTEPRLVA